MKRWVGGCGKICQNSFILFSGVVTIFGFTCVHGTSVGNRGTICSKLCIFSPYVSIVLGPNAVVGTMVCMCVCIFQAAKIDHLYMNHAFAHWMAWLPFCFEHLNPFKTVLFSIPSTCSWLFGILILRKLYLHVNSLVPVRSAASWEMLEIDFQAFKPTQTQTSSSLLLQHLLDEEGKLESWYLAILLPTIWAYTTLCKGYSLHIENLVLGRKVPL